MNWPEKKGGGMEGGHIYLNKKQNVENKKNEILSYERSEERG